MAQAANGDPINYLTEHPVETIKESTGGIGADPIIDAVGVDSERPKTGPAAEEAAQQADRLEAERRAAAPEGDLDATQWRPGDGPSQVSQWAVQAVAKPARPASSASTRPATTATRSARR